MQKFTNCLKGKGSQYETRKETFLYTIGWTFKKNPHPELVPLDKIMAASEIPYSFE